MPRYTTNSKQVLRDGKHFADCIDHGAAQLVAEALNERRGMPQTQESLPLDGADGPLFVGDRVVSRRYEAPKIGEKVSVNVDGRRFEGVVELPKLGATIKGLRCTSCNRPREPYRECPHCPHTHTVRQESDEYACSCGKRWDASDGEDHP